MSNLPVLRRQAAVGGFALITTLLFLLVLSLLAMTMFSSSGTQGKIAGSTLDHQRAMATAEYAIQYGESLLRAGTLAEVNCDHLLDLSQPATSPVVCTNPLNDPTTVPWSAGMLLTPSGMVVQSGGGIAAAASAAGDVNFSRPPSLYIFRLGADSSGVLYQITSAGYGGNASSVSVLQAVVSLQTAR